MIRLKNQWALSVIAACAFISLEAEQPKLSQNMLRIMEQAKYRQATWGVYVKEAKSGREILSYNADKMFLPASTTKLFSTAALLAAYGEDYRFKTPVYALGKLQNQRLEGDLVIVGQGDLTFGGRQQQGSNVIQFTKMDHIIANNVPGAVLTSADPLNGLNALAEQIKEKGILEITGDVVVDDRLFESTERRGVNLTPLMINENLIDFVINPAEVGSQTALMWRPQVEGYTVKNEVQTVSGGGAIDIQISSDPKGEKIVVRGTIPQDQKDVVRTFAVKDSKAFAKAAFIQALRSQGIKLHLLSKPQELPPLEALAANDPAAVWQSPPLKEYVKLILKVSHNIGADLVPLLLAAQKGEKTFEQGMLHFGHFVTDSVKIPAEEFVFIDAAGGDENRLTPKAEVALLEHMRKLPDEQFTNYMKALPILGVDGSLADFAKNTAAVGKVYAKTGTGISYNTAVNKFFLTTQALAGYIQRSDDRLLEFMISVNNAQMPAIDDIFPIFEDLSQLAAMIYALPVENTQ